MKRLLALPNDPITRYLEKGEIKPRYYNAGDTFDEVHLLTWCREDVGVHQVQCIAGKAQLFIHPLGPPTVPNLLRQLARAGSLARDVSPDVIRAYNPWHCGLLALRMARSIGVPLAISIHDDFERRRRVFGGARLRLLKLFERFVLPRATVVICVSEHLAKYARRFGAKCAKTIYNRVDFAKFSTERAYTLEGRTPVVLSVGRLDPQKRQDILIRAVVALDCRLHLVGGGSRESELKELASELGIADRVSFEKAVPHARIPEVYARADIFAMATEHEGFCMPVLEAMASGLPVVACDTPPLPEVLGGCGIVVGNDPGEFRRAIGELASSQERRSDLGLSGRRRAEELDGSRMEELEAGLYASLLGTAI